MVTWPSIVPIFIYKRFRGTVLYQCSIRSNVFLFSGISQYLSAVPCSITLVHPVTGISWCADFCYECWQSHLLWRHHLDFGHDVASVHKVHRHFQDMHLVCLKIQIIQLLENFLPHCRSLTIRCLHSLYSINVSCRAQEHCTGHIHLVECSSLALIHHWGRHVTCWWGKEAHYCDIMTVFPDPVFQSTLTVYWQLYKAQGSWQFSVQIDARLLPHVVLSGQNGPLWWLSPYVRGLARLILSVWHYESHMSVFVSETTRHQPSTYQSRWCTIAPSTL